MDTIDNGQFIIDNCSLSIVHCQLSIPYDVPSGTLRCFTFFQINPMKRNLLLVAAMLFVLSSALSATGQTVKKPFDGCCLGGWAFKGNNANCWTVGTLKVDESTMEAVPLKEGEKGYLINPVGADWNTVRPRRGVDIYTKEKFGDCTVKVEFIITKGSNSGVYLMGEYEVQIADSFGKANDKLGQGDMGAIYSAAAPSSNAAGAPGTWQKFEIEFVAQKFDAGGNKTANALFKKVVLNGKVIQENVSVEKATGGGITMKEAATGPLMLQGNHGPIAFRNIEIIVP